MSEGVNNRSEGGLTIYQRNQLITASSNVHLMVNYFILVVFEVQNMVIASVV
jgi:hypothetical protein